MESRRPLVSVVIPTYNAPALLLETLDSVFAQTFTDYEVVVVNDGSTDDTLRRLEPVAHRLRIVTQPNGGIGAARNRGITEARGKYVAPLDHDDWWMPGKLATQAAYLEGHPECVACSVPFASSVAPDVSQVDRELIADSDGVVREPVRWMAEGRPIILTSALMFDCERCAGLGYEETRGSIEDIPFHLTLFGLGRYAIAGDRVMAVHRDHPGNFSLRSSYPYLGQRVLRAMCGRGAFAGLQGSEREALDRFLAQQGRNAITAQLRGGERRRALELFALEFPHQVRLRRWRFVASFPILWAAPTRLTRSVGPDPSA